jgi:hypothetical protein
MGFATSPDMRPIWSLYPSDKCSVHSYEVGDYECGSINDGARCFLMPEKFLGLESDHLSARLRKREGRPKGRLITRRPRAAVFRARAWPPGLAIRCRGFRS